MISITWQDENGKVIETCSDLARRGWRHVPIDLDDEHTVCLRFIDDYGDTTFNQLQIPILMSELESILPNCEDDEARVSIEALIAFIRRAEGRTHTYIKFIGD